MQLFMSGTPLRMSNLSLAVLKVQPMEIMQTLRRSKDIFSLVRLSSAK